MQAAASRPTARLRSITQDRVNPYLHAILDPEGAKPFGVPDLFDQQTYVFKTVKQIILSSGNGIDPTTGEFFVGAKPSLTSHTSIRGPSNTATYRREPLITLRMVSAGAVPTMGAWLYKEMAGEFYDTAPTSVRSWAGGGYAVEGIYALPAASITSNVLWDANDTDGFTYSPHDPHIDHPAFTSSPIPIGDGDAAIVKMDLFVGSGVPTTAYLRFDLLQADGVTSAGYQVLGFTLTGSGTRVLNATSFSNAGSATITATPAYISSLKLYCDTGTVVFDDLTIWRVARNSNVASAVWLPADDIATYYEHLTDYRCVGLSVLASWVGSSDTNGGMIGGRHVPGDQSGEGHFYHFDKLTSRPGAYSGPLAQGCYAYWRPSDYEDVNMLSLDNLEHLSRGLVAVCGKAATPASAQIKVRIVAMWEAVTTNTMLAGAVRPSVVAPEMMAAAFAALSGQATAFENPLHLAQIWSTVKKVVGKAADGVWSARGTLAPVIGQAVGAAVGAPELGAAAGGFLGRL